MGRVIRWLIALAFITFGLLWPLVINGGGEASDAEDALRIAAGAGDSIDLLLTDVVMPGMNGVDLSKLLRSQYPRIKVIYASGYADSVMLRHGLTDTGAAFVPKPYGATGLAKKIREVLGRESSHSAG